MEKRREININIHLTNRWLYTLIAIAILAAVGVGIYAATYTASGAGHPYTEITTCGINQILKMNAAGNAWTCASDDVGSISTNPLYVEGAITSSEGTLRDDGGGWLRTYGNTGWYSQTYGGGWYMTDTTWLRAYNSKSVYTPGQVRGDAGLCIGTDCRTSWPVTGITTETDPTVKSWAKTDSPSISGDIETFGVIKLMTTLRYVNLGTNTPGSIAPRCPCDISTSATDCGQATGSISYTRVDVGSICYDWYVAAAAYSRKWNREIGGPWVMKTYS